VAAGTFMVGLVAISTLRYEWLPFFIASKWWQILWTEFVLQTVFLAVLAAVLVNIPSRRTK
jgi:hypothetical protein